LDALLSGTTPGEFEIVVAANGCDDRTVAIALERLPGEAVLDLSDPSKIGALNSADAVCTVFPRIYLDADVVLSAAAAREVAGALDSGAALVAAPRPRPVTTGISVFVRWHYSVWERLPVTQDAYVGSGVFAVSAAGHERIAPFPKLIAEDQYVRRSFDRAERQQVSATFDLFPSRTVRALVHRAIRGRAGNAQLEHMGIDLRTEESPRGLAGMVGLLRRPSDWPKVFTFCAITLAIRVGARKKRRQGDLDTWNRDESSRRTTVATPRGPEDAS
jgi:hypothetical protein